MDDYGLLINLHKQDFRQELGEDAETAEALAPAMIDRMAPLKVLWLSDTEKGVHPYAGPAPG
jgi:hypothetical protein